MGMSDGLDAQWAIEPRAGDDAEAMGIGGRVTLDRDPAFAGIVLGSGLVKAGLLARLFAVGPKSL